MRATLRGMHHELRYVIGDSSERGPAVSEVAAATTELIAAQGRLRMLRLAHDRVRTRRRLWLVTGVVTLIGALIVLLAGSGALAVSRLAIGVPVLVAGALMAASMSPRTAREAGQHALDVRKAVTVAVLAVLALLGALVWRPLSYACVLAVALAAVPLLAARETGRRRTRSGGARRG